MIDPIMKRWDDDITADEAKELVAAYDNVDAYVNDAIRSTNADIRSFAKQGRSGMTIAPIEILREMPYYYRNDDLIKQLYDNYYEEFMEKYVGHYVEMGFKAEVDEGLNIAHVKISW